MDEQKLQLYCTHIVATATTEGKTELCGWLIEVRNFDYESLSTYVGTYRTAVSGSESIGKQKTMYTLSYQVFSLKGLPHEI